MSGDPKRLRDLLEAVGARLGIERPASTGALWGRWEEVVGSSVAAHAEPTSLKQGVLRVRTDSPAWANEITYLGDEIRTRANAIVGHELVREVRVWTGPGRVARRTPGIEGVRVDPSKPPEDADARHQGLAEAFEGARRAWAARRSDRG